MKIELKKITVRELTENYQDLQEDGVFGYNNRLDIRPPFQREFVYNDKQREAVIDTIMKGFPLNVMYWADNGNEHYEIIDGQQRTISICQYVDSVFSYQNRYFHNLQDDEKDKILDYELMIYICSGTDSEKLDWFRTINIAGEKLTDQELRNAVYAGPWVTDAKRYFSKTSCPAYQIGNKYMSGTPIRQDYLETVIKWHSNSNNKNSIEEYMAERQQESSASELWLYFQNVINWVQTIFPKYRKEMKGLPWGVLYNQYGQQKFDPVTLEEQVVKLMQDVDVTNKKGIYLYLITGEEKHLNIRAFNEREKREAYERQKGICPMCNEHFEFDEMHADHIVPWSKGGKTVAENCQMLCADDNRKKSNK